MANEDLLGKYRQVVRDVLAKRGWKLVEDEEAFVAEVWQERQRRLQLISPAAQTRRSLVKVIEDATIRRYNHLWYAACDQPGTLRQQQAFTELHQYLSPIAHLRAKNNRYIAQESTQEALIIVYQKLKQVRDPGSFASWAGRIVSNEVIRRVKSQKAEQINESDLLRPHQRAENLLVSKSPAITRGQEQPTDPENIRNKVKSVIQYCLRRSKQRQNVIIKRFLEEKKAGEISQEMGIPAARVSRLINRSIEVLRNCQKMLKLNHEIVLNELEKRGEA